MANYYTPFSLRVSEELLAKIKHIASVNKRSANKEIKKYDVRCSKTFRSLVS